MRLASDFETFQVEDIVLSLGGWDRVKNEEIRTHPPSQFPEAILVNVGTVDTPSDQEDAGENNTAQCTPWKNRSDGPKRHSSGVAG